MQFERWRSGLFTALGRVVAWLLFLAGLGFALVALMMLNPQVDVPPQPPGISVNPWGLLAEATYMMAYAFILGVLCEISDRLMLNT
jgi:hypothetical protein